jgi:hypothetical protein
MAQKTPIAVVEQVLTNTNNPEVVDQIMDKYAVYVSLNTENADLKQILPWAGSTIGSAGLSHTFSRVAKYWEIVNFEVKDMFGSGENVAVFGNFTYKSKTLGKTVVSPFSIHAKVKDEKITYFQFMEDTFATAASFKVSGTSKYRSNPDGGEVEV